MGGQRWRVVADNGLGGVAVREGRDMRAPLAQRRLARDAVVEQEELSDSRMRYTLIEGDGPSSGWVSVVMSGREQLSKEGPAGDRDSRSKNTAAALGLSSGGGAIDAPAQQPWDEYWASFAPTKGKGLSEGRVKEQMRGPGGQIPGIVGVSFEDYDSQSLDEMIQSGWPEKDARDYKNWPVDDRRAFLQAGKQYSISKALDAGEINFSEALACGADFRLMTIDDASMVLRGLIASGGGGPEHVSASPLR